MYRKQCLDLDISKYPESISQSNSLNLRSFSPHEAVIPRVP
jgi:hypothetical protein